MTATPLTPDPLDAYGADRLVTERTRHAALLDPVTGLPKWELLLDRLDVALAHCRRTGLLVAVFVLDSPKPYEGHDMDVAALAGMLRASVRACDTLARVGARRFAVVCNDIRVDEDAALVARRLVNRAGVICRLGIALGTTGDTAEALLREAVAEATMAAVTH